MTGAFFKNTFREIIGTKARFFSIMAIIALGVGFFTGIKATSPSMYHLAESYYSEKKLMDFRLVSTTGFSSDDISAIAAADGVQSVMPSYFLDVVTVSEDGGDLIRLIAVPESYQSNAALNEIVLDEGRSIEHCGEIITESVGFANSHHQVGDIVRFAPMAGDTAVSDMLNTDSFAIVGKAQSPLYISYQRGNSPIGDGQIDEYMYVSLKDFKVERYTELYVKADYSDNLSPFSDEYDEKNAQLKDALEKIAEDREEVFQIEVIDKAQSELSQAKEIYENEKCEADTKLADAKQRTQDAELEYESQIAEAEQKLQNAHKEIANGETELAEGENAYYKSINDAEKQLYAKESELEETEKVYQTALTEAEEKIRAAQEQIDRDRAEWEAAHAEFIRQAEYISLSEKTQAYSEESEWTTEQIQTAPHQADENMEVQLEESQRQLDEAQAELDRQALEGKEQLEVVKEQIDSGRTELEAAKKEFEYQRTIGWAQLQDARETLANAKNEYQTGLSEFETEKRNGRVKLDAAKEDYQKNEEEAEEKFSEARQEIEDAQQQVDRLFPSEWYVFNREDNPGYTTFSQNADRLDAVASVFPLFFLLVAVLVCVTTMTRLIEEKRTEIATIKALGYGNGSIILKYVIYSLLAAVSGSIIGITAGVFTLPFIIYNAYKIMFYIGDITLMFHLPSIVLGILAAVLTTTVVSVLVCAKSLRLKPAQAMRPKAPKAGKRILMERITPLWKRMGFSAKLTARNLFRYKIRMCMTILGVAGCTALIVAAFGLLNSFEPLTEVQFGEIYRYDAVAVPKNSGTPQELQYMQSIAADTKCVEDMLLISQEDITVCYDGREHKTATHLWTMEDNETFQQIIHLRTRHDHLPLELHDDGVMVNEKLAATLGCSVGDTVMLSTDEHEAEAVVRGIYEQYVNNYIYITKEYYHQLFGQEPEYNLLTVRLTDNDEATQNCFSSVMLQDERIAAVSFMGANVWDFKNMLNSLNMVVVVMVVCAAALAFVVLYNLTNINIAERMREIATFKVLGFYNKETSSFIYKENVILTLLGILGGLALGGLLTGFIIRTVEVDNVMFGRDIYWTTYLYASGLTLFFSLLVNTSMGFKIKAVNMVESLKSVE